MRAIDFIAVFIGGGLGSLCRYAISLMVLRFSESRFPIATLSANVLSCIIMAAFLIYASTRIPEGAWIRLFILVGFCGGFSTFSTFSLENFQLIRLGEYTFLTLNILLSLILCISVFYFYHKGIKTL